MRDKNKAATVILAGISLEFLGGALIGIDIMDLSLIGLIVLFIGILTVMWGAGSYARSIGYYRILGILLGFLSFVGLIVLVILPDKQATKSDAQ